MAYKDIPLETDEYQQSQVDIKENFSQISSLVSQDHETFGTGDELGKHIQTTFTTQALHPSTLATELKIYCKNNTATPHAPALWIQKAGVDEAVAPEVTAGWVDFTTATREATGYTKLPSGIMFKWGSGTVGDNTTATAIYDATVPFTHIYSVQVCIQGRSGNSGAFYYQSFSMTRVIVYNASNQGGRTFQYFVIGD